MLYFAITIQVKNDHILNSFFCLLYPFLSKKKFGDLDVYDQDLYLEYVFLSPLKGTGGDLIYVNEFQCETHPNITSFGGKEKRHLHGFVQTDFIDLFFQNWGKTLKVFSNKFMLNQSIHIEPIHDFEYWKKYMNKTIQEIDQSLYKFGKKNII